MIKKQQVVDAYQDYQITTLVGSNFHDLDV